MFSFHAGKLCLCWKVVYFKLKREKDQIYWPKFQLICAKPHFPVEKYITFKWASVDAFEVPGNIRDSFGKKKISTEIAEPETVNIYCSKQKLLKHQLIRRLRNRKRDFCDAGDFHATRHHSEIQHTGMFVHFTTATTVWIFVCQGIDMFSYSSVFWRSYSLC